MRQPKAKNWSSVSQSREQQEDAAGEEEADRRAELRKHAVPGALARRRVLDRQQHRAAPLAAEAQALAEAAQRQQQRRGDADRVVGRQHADRHRRHAHRQQRRHQRRLAADAVAEVAEQRRADRPREEGDRRTSPATPAWPRPDRTAERTAAGRPAPPRWRRCRSRRTRSSCRSGWRTAPGAAC